MRAFRHPYPDRQTLTRWRSAIGAQLRRSGGLDHGRLIGLALIMGLVSGHAAVGFYFLIEILLAAGFGTSSTDLVSGSVHLEWWHIITVPVVAGLIVGQILRFISFDRAHGVAEVIESAALKDSRFSARDSILSAAATVLSLSGGASTGREGPVVHIGASIASFITQRLKLNKASGRTLLGAGVAAAVAASFNAPIAGVFFALEVIIGHYALHTFAPIVIAAIAGTLVSRYYLGDFPAFEVTDYIIASPWEFPAFFLLGITAALVAALFMVGFFRLSDARDRYLGTIPIWAQPAIGGLIIGSIALIFPEILSVGYEATNHALNGSYGLGFMLVLLAAKLFATILSLVFRFAGGVFSPSLFMGAMLGGSIGLLAAGLAPDLASHQGVYAVAGMGAFASAVLGAPISTILMVFEITGDYSITIAVMVASAMASVTIGFFPGGSFFHRLLAQRGIWLEGGRASYLMKSSRVSDYLERDFITCQEDERGDVVRSLLVKLDGDPLTLTDSSGKFAGVVRLSDLSDVIFSDQSAHDITASELVASRPMTLFADLTINEALLAMEGSGEMVMPVLSSPDNPTVIGLVRHRKLLAEYNRALLESQGR